MAAKSKEKKLISIVMGSQSDWSTMKNAAIFLEELNIPYEKKVVSAHRTPGMIASLTSLPVLGVPIESKVLKGIDSLLSIAQMPAGIPVGTLAIGDPGAKNSAILALSIISVSNKSYLKKLEKWKKNLTKNVPLHPNE